MKEVVPGRSNNEMILVLQYYDYCVERTIQAYLEGEFHLISKTFSIELEEDKWLY